MLLDDTGTVNVLPASVPIFRTSKTHLYSESGSVLVLLLYSNLLELYGSFLKEHFDKAGDETVFLGCTPGNFDKGLGIIPFSTGFYIKILQIAKTNIQ